MKSLSETLSTAAVLSIVAERRRGLEIIRSFRAKISVQPFGWNGASNEADCIFETNGVTLAGQRGSRYLAGQRSSRNRRLAV